MARLEKLAGMVIWAGSTSSSGKGKTLNWDGTRWDH